MLWACCYYSLKIRPAWAVDRIMACKHAHWHTQTQNGEALSKASCNSMQFPLSRTLWTIWWFLSKHGGSRFSKTNSSELPRISAVKNHLIRLGVQYARFFRVNRCRWRWCQLVQQLLEKKELQENPAVNTNPKVTNLCILLNVCFWNVTLGGIICFHIWEVLFFVSLIVLLPLPCFFLFLHVFAAFCFYYFLVFPLFLLFCLSRVPAFAALCCLLFVLLLLFL